MIVQFPAHIAKIETMADKSIRLKIDSMLELSGEQKAIIFDFQDDKPLWVALAETDVKTEDLEIPETLPDTDEKSPSQRLRSRMWVYYKETHGKTEGFNQWYADTLDSIGQKYLDKLA